MPNRRELTAMAWGYGLTIPIGAAALYLGAPLIIAPIIFLIGFLVTMVNLNWN